ncbi:Predicted dienelactone hydrolase [Legionella beliardensis]|uniref:Predicted dienelactone hydrolase n=1 Tax=Legionella beliardensis TaxID=91822 RepID=A0A378I3W1_9GAMM|nr:alpha/beta hydrolase [Legionella beliardensis]STX29376.1 Predicted dienelactone hydrolase [Legionella beliardensis]
MGFYSLDKVKQITILTANATLSGFLFVPKEAIGLVLFAHGSGSSARSTRNQYVAGLLNQANLATLLFDLLTPTEEKIDDITRELRFNISFLVNRLIEVTHWSTKQFPALNLGYFGASTGAAAALVAAAKEQALIKAVVSRGGRPDLAGNSLTQVKAPTLLIVGEKDKVVIELNELAMTSLTGCVKQLEIVPRATHLFEEKGALAKVAELAKNWFTTYLPTA